MLYREIIAVCSQIHTKHINTVFGQKNHYEDHMEQIIKLMVKMESPSVGPKGA